LCIVDSGSSVAAIGAGVGETAVTSHSCSGLSSDVSVSSIETPEAVLGNLASDVLDAFGVFRGKWGVIIGDRECLLVEIAKIREAHELGFGHVRKGERVLWRRRVDGSHKAVSRCVVITVFNEVGGSFDSCSLPRASSLLGGLYLFEGAGLPERIYAMGGTGR